MALVYGGLDRIKMKYPDFNSSKCKFIGWGAGQWFNDYFPSLNITLEYTICPIIGNNGVSIHGVEVRPPEALQLESHEEIFILIIAAHRNEIINQIREIGPYKCMHALDFELNNVPIYNDLLSLSSSKFTYFPIDFSTSLENNSGKVAIFHTGPLHDYAELALKYNRLQHPQYFQILVTWNNESAERVLACSKWVDEIIQIDYPINPGISNINFMLKSNKCALDFINERNFKYGLRVRTGNLVIGNINKFVFEYDSEFNSLSKKFGFYCNWSWKNIPFHISDAFMFGKVSDLLNLWSAREDDRKSIENLTLASARLTDFIGNTAETYLWGNYAKSVGYDSHSLEHYYDFILANLVPIEPILNTISIKHIPAFSIDYDSNLSPSPSWWLTLNKQKSLEKERGLARFISNNSLKDFWSSKIG
jgi:hypothetical protein